MESWSSCLASIKNILGYQIQNVDTENKSSNPSIRVTSSLSYALTLNDYEKTKLDDQTHSQNKLPSSKICKYGGDVIFC